MTAIEGVTCVLYGFGRINRAVLELSLERPWLSVAAIVVRTGSDTSRRPSEVVPGADPALVLETDPQEAFRRVRPDVAIVATRPRLAEVMPQLRIAAAGSRVVLCTAEELAYLEPTDGPLAAEVHELARTSGSRIVPVGVNPGFLFDQWPLAAAALAWTIDRISVRRVVDVSAFSLGSRRHLGIGLTEEELAAGISDGSVAGHIGFQQSVRIIAAALGASVESTSMVLRPLFADEPAHLGDGTIPTGHSVGIEQKAVATVSGRPWIELSLTFHASPSLHGLEPMDALDISGRHEVSVRIPRGIRPGPATAALLVNTIPSALRAPPGYHRAGTLRQPAPWLAATSPV